MAQGLSTQLQVTTDNGQRTLSNAGVAVGGVM